MQPALPVFAKRVPLDGGQQPVLYKRYHTLEELTAPVRRPDSSTGAAALSRCSTLAGSRHALGVTVRCTVDVACLF